MQQHSQYAKHLQTCPSIADNVEQKLNDQTKEIETFTADVDRLQKQNAHLQARMEKAAELARANTELSKVKENMAKQLDSLALQLNNAKDDVKAARGEAQTLKAELATRDTAPVASNDKALLGKIKELEEKKDSLEGALAEWTELAKVCLCVMY